MRHYAGLLPRLAQFARQQQQHLAPPATAAAATASAAAAAAAASAAWSASTPRCASSFAAAAPLARGFVQFRYVLGVGSVVAAAQFDAVTDAAKLGLLAVVRLGRDVATAAAIVAGGRACMSERQQQPTQMHGGRSLGDG